MKKHNKILLFILCLFIFLAATPVIIFYSQGYRFDWTARKITQTGGLFIKAKPKGIKIRINGLSAKETESWLGSALLLNLMPGQYKVNLEKEGYRPWEKELKIEAKMVTEAKNVVLWPEDIKFETIAGGVENFLIAPDQKKAAILEFEKSEIKNAEPEKPPAIQKKQTLKFYDLERNIKSQLITQNNFRDKNVEITDISWSPDSQKILLETVSQEKNKYFILQVIPSAKLTQLDFLPEDAFSVEFAGSNPQKILFQKSEGSNSKIALFEADLKEKLVNPAPIIKDFSGYTAVGENLYWLGEDGYFYESSLKNGREEKISQNAFAFQKGDLERKFYVKADAIFFLEEKTLYRFSKNSKNFEKISEEVLSINLAPDSKKIVIAENHEIQLLYLENDTAQPDREIDRTVFLTRLAQPIDKIYWLNPYYLVFNAGNEIKIIEIDDRGNGPQIWTIADFPKPDISFNTDNAKLYIKSENKILSSNPLF